MEKPISAINVSTFPIFNIPSSYRIKESEVKLILKNDISKFVVSFPRLEAVSDDFRGPTLTSQLNQRFHFIINENHPNRGFVYNPDAGDSYNLSRLVSRQLGYRDLLVYGIGYHPDLLQRNLNFTLPNSKQLSLPTLREVFTSGLINDRSALTDHMHSVMLEDLGEFRVPRTIGLYGLNQVSLNHKLIPLDVAKGLGWLPHNFNPVLVARLFRTRHTLDDLATTENKVSMVKEALDMMNLEFKPSVKFDLMDYSRWFAESVGKQVVAMKRYGFKYPNFSSRNITLSGELFDFSTSRFLRRNHNSLTKDNYLIGTDIVTKFSDLISKIHDKNPDLISDLPPDKNKLKSELLTSYHRYTHS